MAWAHYVNLFPSVPPCGVFLLAPLESRLEVNDMYQDKMLVIFLTGLKFKSRRDSPEETRKLIAVSQIPLSSF